MSIGILCILFFIFYGILMFFDSVFKSCMNYPYYAFLEGTGLKVGFLHISWTTTAFNRSLYRYGKSCARFLNKWFICGYIITQVIFLPFALWTLFSVLFNHFDDTIEINSITEVQAIIPGVNIPLSDFGVYFLSLCLSSITHELGHALAAVQEDIQLISVGLFLFTVIPIAFVKLNMDHLNSLSIQKRLKIYCAGVWHNLASAAVALILFLTVPYLFGVAYKTDVGVRVVQLTYDSPLKGGRGLSTGDVITHINGCEVKNEHDWNFCISMAHQRYGICMTASYIAEHDELTKEIVKDNGIVECCHKEDLFGFCFEYVEPKTNEESQIASQYSCLKPRNIVENSYTRCTEIRGYSCHDNMLCMRPSLNNQTFLMIIDVQDNRPIIYVGSPYDLYRTVIVDHYFPRFWIFSFFSPSSIEKLLHYTFVFSMGIGFINILPCYGTDGHHIARNLIQLVALYFGKNEDFVTFLTVLTVVCGTGITIPTLVYLFYNSFANT